MDNQDKIIDKLLDQDNRLDLIEQNMFSKNDGQKMMDVLEGVATIVKKIQEDHTFAIEWLKRLQTQIERQEDEIRLIKQKLQLA